MRSFMGGPELPLSQLASRVIDGINPSLEHFRTYSLKKIFCTSKESEAEYKGSLCVVQSRNSNCTA